MEIDGTNFHFENLRYEQEGKRKEQQKKETNLHAEESKLFSSMNCLPYCISMPR